MIQSYGLSDVGCVRQSNQDRIHLAPELGVFLLADGMGGHGHGEIAAQEAIDAAWHFLSASQDGADVTWPFGFDVRRSMEENRLNTSFLLANHMVWRRASQVPEYAGMGTTLTGVILYQNRLSVANVGDSRAYLIRDGQMRQLTEDDTWVGNLIRSGALTEAQAKTHPMRHVLTQAVGSARPIEVRTLDCELASGDFILLTSDGVHGVVTPPSLLLLTLADAPLEQRVGSIVSAARDLGAPDNASCVLVRYTAD